MGVEISGLNEQLTSVMCSRFGVLLAMAVLVTWGARPAAWGQAGAGGGPERSLVKREYERIRRTPVSPSTVSTGSSVTSAEGVVRPFHSGVRMPIAARATGLAHLVGFTSVTMDVPAQATASSAAEKLVVHYPPALKALTGAYYSRYRLRAADSLWLPVTEGESVAEADSLLAVVGSASAGSIAVRSGRELLVQTVSASGVQGQLQRVRLPKSLLKQEMSGQRLKLLSLENGIGMASRMDLPALMLSMPSRADVEALAGKLPKKPRLERLPDAKGLLAEVQRLKQGALSQPPMPDLSKYTRLPEVPFDLSQLSRAVSMDQASAQFARVGDSLRGVVPDSAFMVDALEQRVKGAAPNVDSSVLRQFVLPNRQDLTITQLPALPAAPVELNPAQLNSAQLNPAAVANREQLQRGFASAVGRPSDAVKGGAAIDASAVATPEAVRLTPAPGLLGGTRISTGSKAANVWYFGSGVGLDFNQSPPRLLHDGALRQLEGSASVCDASGQLLFYTDGQTIYDRRHQPMANGTGLKGHASSSTGALIAPYPGKAGDYLVFTSGFGGYGAEAGEGIFYSVVRFSLTQPWGEVITRDQAIEPEATERMVAVEHADGESVWLISQIAGKSEFHAHLFTREGLGPQPVVSRANHISPRSGSTIGFLKASLDGQRLALTNLGDWQVELYDFDADNGVVSYRYDLSHEVLRVQPELAIRTPYGLEFSPDGNWLYVSCTQTGELRRFDLRSGNAEAVARSQQRFKSDDFDGRMGAIQLSPDGRLLFTAFDDRLGRPSRLGVIERPNESAPMINFIGYEIGESLVSYGLPIQFPRYIRQMNGDIHANRFCAGAPTNFEAGSNLKPDSYSWDFGDHISGNDNVDTGKNVTHTFRNPGQYVVTLTLRQDQLYEQISRTVKISTPPQLELGWDIRLPLGSSTILTAEVDAEEFQWGNGNRNKIIAVSAAGQYKATALRESCVCVDSLSVIPLWLKNIENQLNNYNNYIETFSNFNFISKPSYVKIIPILGVQSIFNTGTADNFMISENRAMISSNLNQLLDQKNMWGIGLLLHITPKW